MQRSTASLDCWWKYQVETLTMLLEYNENAQEAFEFYKKKW